MPEHFELRRLLESSSFGPNARFAAMGGRTVLVDEPGQPSRVVQLASPADSAAPPGSYASYSLPASELEVVDVDDDGALDPSSKVYALVCTAPTQCSLWRRGVTGDAKLEQLAGSELDWRPRGLAMDHATDSPVPCVHGAKLECFDGSWHEQLTAPDGVEIVDVALDRRVSFAIGTETKVWIRTDPSEGWRAHWLAPTLSQGIELSGVSVSDRYGAAFGAHGEVLSFEENVSWICQWSSELALVSPSSSLDGVTLVTKHGRVLRRSSTSGADFCESQQLDAGVISFGSHVQCSASNNMWLATEHQVWGEFTCLEVP